MENVSNDKTAEFIVTDWGPQKVIPADLKYPEFYVSFNLPVAADIHIRIRTGFDISEDTSGFTDRSLIINKNNTRTSPNTFIGTIFEGTSNT